MNNPARKVIRISPAFRRECEVAEVEATAKRGHIKARHRASENQVEFDLSWDDALAMLRAGDHRCAVSGLRFRTREADRSTGKRAAFQPSLDRIDCRRGYVAGNVRWVLTAVNLALNDWGDDVLLEIAAHIVLNNLKRTKKAVTKDLQDDCPNGKRL